MIKILVSYMYVCTYIGDAITRENTRQNDFPYACIITTIISILFIILCIASCLFCYVYNQLHHKRNELTDLLLLCAV